MLRSLTRGTAAAALLLLLCATAASPTAAAQFVSGDDPVVGEAMRLTQATDTLVVTYRPSSSIARTDTLLDVREWAPTQAGVVKLAAASGVPMQNVSVRFAGTPVPGLLVLLGAGLILFGGAGYAFRKLFEEEKPAAP